MSDMSEQPRITKIRKIPYSLACQLDLKQDPRPREVWKAVHDQIVELVPEPLGGSGSYALAVDSNGNKYYIEWDSYGDECYYYQYWEEPES